MIFLGGDGGDTPVTLSKYFPVQSTTGGAVSTARADSDWDQRISPVPAGNAAQKT